MTSDDAWPFYADTRDQFISLIRSLDTGQANTYVPHCPDWTVAGVASHVCGLNADLAAGMREGLGSEENTALQVDVRADMSLGEIADEWLEAEPAVIEAFASMATIGPALVADLVVHLHDVQHALRLEIDRGDNATLTAARRYVDVMQQRALGGPGIGVAVEFSNGESFPAPQGAESSLTVKATPYDFLRSFTGRRSRRQIEALDWTGDPTRLLDEAWSPYGQPPVEDSEV